jgi:hypothetical protein
MWREPAALYYPPHAPYTAPLPDTPECAVAETAPAPAGYDMSTVDAAKARQRNVPFEYIGRNFALFQSWTATRPRVG